MKKYFIIGLVIIGTSCVKEKTIQFPQFGAMGTTVSFTLVLQNENPYELLPVLKNKLNTLEKIFSRYDPASEVSDFNKKTGIVSVSKQLYHLIVLAKETYHKTKVFDITLLPIIKLWDYKKGIIPSKDQINHVKDLVGFDNIELLPDLKIKKLKPVEIDLGGIAKGYAANECYLLLKEYGIHAGIIRIGGEIIAFGKEWKVGILDPKTKMPLYAVVVKDKAVSTSGDYERFFEIDGKNYSHIIDPRTFRPAQVIAHGVTVIGDPIIDSIPTSFFILGPDKSFAVLKKYYPELSAIFIMPDRSALKSEYFPYLLEKVKE